jgi:CO/xanthine dehydrogenase FAD-binding subunit
MDLPNIETYLQPCDIKAQCFANLGDGWAWLAGGTWLFSEPQPHIKTLVDMQSLGWSEIELVEPPTLPQSRLNNQILSSPWQAQSLTTGKVLKQILSPPWQGGLGGMALAIGATCPLVKLLEYPWLSEWTAVDGFKGAISALSVSFKVINMATVGGNICLALSVGTFAPLMVALDASYEIWNLQGDSRQVAAKDFQIGFKKTILQPGEVLRRILIPIENLNWKVNYQRLGIATGDPALAIVVTACNQSYSQVRVVIGASVPAPCLEGVCSQGDVRRNDITDILIKSFQGKKYINDTKASAGYRRDMTSVLIRRSLEELKIKN